MPACQPQTGLCRVKKEYVEEKEKTIQFGCGGGCDHIRQKGVTWLSRVFRPLQGCLHGNNGVAFLKEAARLRPWRRTASGPRQGQEPSESQIVTL